MSNASVKRPINTSPVAQFATGTKTPAGVNQHALRRADRNFRGMRAALNAGEGDCFERMFAGWRLRWRVDRLRHGLKHMGFDESALPPPRKAYVQKKVPIAVTDVAWHEQLRLWWWPPSLSPDIDA